MFKTSYIAFFLLLLSSFVWAGVAEPESEKNLTSHDSRTLNEKYREISNRLSLIRDSNNRDYRLLSSKMEQQVLQTENSVFLLQEKVKNLEKQLLKLHEPKQTKTQDGMTFEVWAGLVLASVAVIVTALGVGIAILSFFGYKATINKASEKASEIAPITAKKVILEKIENGDFDKTIEDAVEKITYRGVLADWDEELDKNGSTREE